MHLEQVSNMSFPVFAFCDSRGFRTNGQRGYTEVTYNSSTFDVDTMVCINIALN